MTNDFKNTAANPTESPLWEPPSDLPKTLPQMVRQSAERFANRAAIVDGAVTIGYPQLLAHSETVARALIALGIEAGDRRALCWCPSTPA